MTVSSRSTPSPRPTRSAGARLGRIARTVARGVGRHELSTRAAALTYGALFSLVPTLAVAFAMFKAFGGLAEARDVLLPRLLDYVAVGSQGVVETQIDGFIQNVHEGALGGVGTVVLLYAVVSLMSEVEHSLDRIWDVPVGRPFLRRATMYWTTVTVTPTLLLAGVTLPAALANVGALSWLVAGPVGRLVLSVLLPLGFVYAGFVTVYLLVPNTRVPVHAALIGGVVGGSLWLAAVSGYAYYASVSVTYSRIYGSLGALAVFLIWVYVTWLIVLVGAEVAAAVQSAAGPDDTIESADLSPAARELIALRVLSAITSRFLAAGPPLAPSEIADEIHQPAGLVTWATLELRLTDLIVEDGDGRLVPARDPRGTSPADALHALRQRGKRPTWCADDPVATQLEALGKRAEGAWAAVWGEVTLEELPLREPAAR